MTAPFRSVRHRLPRVTPRRLRDCAWLPSPLVALAAGACSTSAPRATPPIVPGGSATPREVNIITKDYSFLPDAVDLVPGETVLLHVINGGLEVHEAVLGDAAVQDAWELPRPPRPDDRPGRRRSSASRRTCRACGSSSPRASGSTSSGRSRQRRRPTPAAGSSAATSRATGRAACRSRSGGSAHPPPRERPRLRERPAAS